MVLVSEEEVKEAMRFVLLRLKLVVEPTGAVAAAAALSGKLRRFGRRAGVDTLRRQCRTRGAGEAPHGAMSENRQLRAPARSDRGALSSQAEQCLIPRLVQMVVSLGSMPASPRPSARRIPAAIHSSVHGDSGRPNVGVEMP